MEVLHLSQESKNHEKLHTRINAPPICISPFDGYTSKLSKSQFSCTTDASIDATVLSQRRKSAYHFLIYGTYSFGCSITPDNCKTEEKETAWVK